MTPPPFICVDCDARNASGAEKVDLIVRHPSDRYVIRAEVLKHETHTGRLATVDVLRPCRKDAEKRARKMKAEFGHRRGPIVMDGQLALTGLGD